MGPLVVPALSTALSLGTQLAAAIPGKYEKEQKRRLEELQGNVAAGQGLSGAEQQLMQNTGLAGVRAAGGSMASELGRLQAAGGGLGGGAALQGQRELMAGQLGSAAEKVGARVGAANIEALEQKRKQIADIMAAQAERRAALLGGAAGTVSDFATQAGQVIGAKPPEIGKGASYANEAAAARAAQPEPTSVRYAWREGDTGYQPRRTVGSVVRSILG